MPRQLQYFLDDANYLKLWNTNYMGHLADNLQKEMEREGEYQFVFLDLLLTFTAMGHGIFLEHLSDIGVAGGHLKLV